MKTYSPQFFVKSSARALDLTKPVGKKRRRGNPLVWIVVAAAVIFLLGALLFFAESKKDVFSGSIRSQANFPLYSPTQLPPGYSIDRSSFRYSRGVVFFSIKYSGYKTLLVSEQKNPSDMSVVHNFFQTGLTSTQTIYSHLGTAVMGDLGKIQASSLETDQTWIIISAPNGIGWNELGQITQSLNLN